ncbi:MAG: excisionase [Macromonas sp.]
MTEEQASGTIVAHITPARFVTVDLAAAVTGLSASAIRNHITRGHWVERREYIRNHGRVFVDLKGFEKWVQQAA